MTTNVNASVVLLKQNLDGAVSDLTNAIEHIWNGIEFTDGAQPPRNMTWGPDDLYLMERDAVRTMVELRAAKRLLEMDLPAEPGETVMIPRNKYDSAMADIGYAVDYTNWVLGELNPSLDPWYQPLNYAAVERTFVQNIQYVKSAIRTLTSPP